MIEANGGYTSSLPSRERSNSLIISGLNKPLIRRHSESEKIFITSQRILSTTA
jgi:hypothetical protein